MRASLAAQPLAAMLAGYALARGLEGGPLLRATAATAIASIVIHAISDWRMCLGLERFWTV